MRFIRDRVMRFFLLEKVFLMFLVNLAVFFVEIGEVKSRFINREK